MTDTAAKIEPKATAAKAVVPAAPVVAAPASVTTKPEPKPPVAIAKAAPAPIVKAVPAPIAKKPAVKKPVRVVKAAAKTKAVSVPRILPKKPSAAKPAAPAAKETKMTDTIKTITDKTQSFFADANARAKGSMEKGAKAFEDVTAFHKGNIEAVVESTKIAAKGAEKIGQDAAAYAKISFEKATETLKALSAVKSPTELFKLQSDYARASFDAFVAETSRSTEAALKLAGEVAQPISNRFAIAAEKLKVAA